MLVSLSVKMLYILVLCPALLAAAVQTLTIDSQLGTSIEDCFERISIGEQLPRDAIYRNVTELTTRECEQICKQDKQCQSYDYGVGAKGNATCNLSNSSEKELKEKTMLLRHPDYDVYVRRFQCEQSPPSPIPQFDDPGDTSDRPVHRPVHRPVEEKPFADDYLVSTDLASYGVQRPVYKPQYDERPDDYSNPKPDYDSGPSYGAHKPQEDSYKPQKPVEKPSYSGRPDPYDILHLQDPYRPEERPEHLTNNYGRPPNRPYIPEKPQYQYFTRPKPKPQADTGFGNKPGYDRPNYDDPGYPNPSRPYDRPRPVTNGQYASGYGQNIPYDNNDVHVQILDPIRPYDRPRPSDQGIYGYGSYSAQNSYSQSQSSHSQYYGGSGYGIIPSKPNQPIFDIPHPSYSGDNYGQKPTYGNEKPGYGNQVYDSSQSSYQRPYGNHGSYGSQYYGGISQKPVNDYYRPYGDYNRPSQDPYGDNNSYGGSQGNYGNNQSSYGTNQGSKPSYENDKPSYGNEKPSYGNEQGSYTGTKPSYGNDEGSYSSSKPPSNDRPSYGNDQASYGGNNYENDRPGYGNEKPSYGNDQPNYGTNKPSYGNDRPTYGNDKPSYDDRPSYGSNKPSHDPPSYGTNKPSYGNDRPSYGNEKPLYDKDPPYGGNKPSYDQPSYSTNKPLYGNDQPSYGSNKPSYGNDQPSYGSNKPSYGNDQPSYGSNKPSYGNDQPSYGSNKPSYANDQPSYGSIKPSHGDDQPSYGSNKPSYGNNRPQYNQDSYGNSDPYGSQYYGSHSSHSTSSHHSYDQETYGINGFGGYGGNQPSYGGQNDFNRPSYGNRPLQDLPSYGGNRPSRPSYGTRPSQDQPTYGEKPQKPKPENDDANQSYGGSTGPGYDENRPDSIKPDDGNDTGYGNDKLDKPGLKPVYEYELEKPLNAPSYISRPGGEIITSRPMTVGNFDIAGFRRNTGKPTSYEEGTDFN